MGDSVKQMLTKLVQLTHQIVKAATEAGVFKQELAEIVSKTENLAAALSRAAAAGSPSYERPARRIIHETELVLQEALSLVLKCKRVFSIIAADAFQATCSKLGHAADNFIWLSRVAVVDPKEKRIRVPPIALKEPILSIIWEQIAILYSGSEDDRSNAAASLASWASNRSMYGKMIIEEGGAQLLLKLVKEGRPEDQESATKGIGLLAQDPDSVDQLLVGGLCFVFEKILREGPMVVQAKVAWAISELVQNHPECRGVFAHNSIMRLLVAHLAFEIVQDHSGYAVVINKATSVCALVNATANSKEREKERALGLGLDDDQVFNNNEVPRALEDQKPNQLHAKYRELEDAATKAGMKAMAVKALCELAKGNPQICRSISESRALMCFVVLLEEGEYEVRYNSAVALMEITAVAEKDADLRRSVFKPSSPACKAIIDQLLRVIDKEEDIKLLVPCIKAAGNLATTWTAGTRMSTPLVKFLNGWGGETYMEAITTLTKLACPENYIHVDHSRAIISAGGAKYLMQIVYFGPRYAHQLGYYDERDQLVALRLLCYISRHAPDSEELVEADVLALFNFASCQAFVNKDQTLVSLLDDAKSRVGLYQRRKETNDFGFLGGIVSLKDDGNLREGVDYVHSSMVHLKLPFLPRLKLHPPVFSRAST